MIQINLVPGPQKRRAGAGISLPSFADLVGKIKEPLLIGAIASWAVVLAVLAFLYLTQSRQLGDLRERQTTVQNDARRFRTLIAQKRRESDTRDSLVAELRAIREVDSDRFVWPHIMEEISKALPDFTWLVSIDVLAPSFDETADTTVRPPVRFQIDGRTSDINAFTRFASQLANSPWIRNVEFGAVQSVIEDDQAVRAFTLTVEYQTADSAFIRTVPLQASVR